MKPMRLEDVLFSQGFGTRRVCAGLVQQGYVSVNNELQEDPGVFFDLENLKFKVQGTECSQKPSTWPSIYTLLPSPLRLRPQKAAVQGVQAVGRLDQDTTGLLLLTDDGKFIHRMSSPKHHMPKVYEVTTKHEITAQQVEKLLSGVVLDDSPKPVQAAACEKVSDTHLKLTLTEGKYHQVKRMLAAVGNRVEGLHRSAIGNLQLPADLAPGQWRWILPSELEKYFKA